eukprot:4244707-Karenia_brevis.AAC.1
MLEIHLPSLDILFHRQSQKRQILGSPISIIPLLEPASPEKKQNFIRLKGRGREWLGVAHREARERWENLLENERTEYNTVAA